MQGEVRLRKRDGEEGVRLSCRCLGYYERK